MASDGQKPRGRKKVARKILPPSARRLEFAFLQAGFVDEKGGVDKKRVAELFPVVPKTIESWIKGRTEPGFAYMAKISDFTNADLTWIITGKGAPPVATGYRRISEQK